MKMPPPATRWLCFLILLVHGVRGQLSVGGADSFLLDDLDATGGDAGIDEAIGTTSSPDTAAADRNSSSVVENAADINVNIEDAADYDSQPAVTPDEPLEETTLPDFDYDLMDELAVTTESGLPEDEINKRTGSLDYYDYLTDFGTGLDNEGDMEEATSPVPQLTRRIIYSGGPSLTATLPEPSVAFTRPSSVVRGLTDTDQDEWLPNWPSHLIDNNSRSTRRPTIRFPTGPPPTVIVPSPVPSSAIVPVPTPVPSTDPSFTVSKVPVTQYFFDLPSAVPTPVPGPLFDQDDLSVTVSASPSIETDLNRPVIELSSSISELQSSVLMEAARPFTVTPSLSGLDSSVTKEIAVDFSSSALAATPVSSLAFSLTSTISDEAVEREVVDNNLDDKTDGDNIAFGTENDQDHGTETTGPRPPHSRPDSLGDGPDYFESTTSVADPADTNGAALPATGELQPISSATTSAPAQPNPASGSELVTTTRTSALGSVKPAFIRTSQAANSSRTPLWMLLSQSTPSRTVNTQPLSSQPASAATSSSATNTLTALATSPPPNRESVTDPLESDVPSTPTLLPSTHNTDELPETTVQSSTVLDDISNNSTQNDTPSDVIATLIPTEAIITTPGINASVTANPTQDFTESSTSGPSHNNGSELTPDPVSLYDPSSDIVRLDTDFSDNNIPVIPETTESIGEPTSSPLNRSSLSHSPEGNIMGNTTERDQGTTDEPLVITLPEEIDPPFTLREISTVVTPTEISRVTLKDNASWTPVLNRTGNTVQSVPVTSLSTVVPTISQVSPLPPEMTGGFTPIRSETDQSVILPRTEVLPEISSIPSPTSTPSIVESTATFTAPFDDSSTKFAPPPSITDFSAATPIWETSLVSDIDHSILEEGLTSSVILKNEVESSPVFFPTAVQTSLKDETTSIPLDPMVTEPIPTPSLSVISVSEVQSTPAKNPEPTIIVTEKLPSSPTIYIPEIFPSSSESSVSVTPTATKIANSSSVPPLSSIPLASSDSPITPDIPLSSASVATLPTSFTGSSWDSSILVAPTATDVTGASSTQITNPDVLIEGPEEGTHGESPEKEESAVVETPSSTPSTTNIPTPITVTTPTTSTTTKTTTTKVTAPPTTATSPVPKTTSSEVPTIIAPTETMPSLTTAVMLPNGTVIELPLPYIRALVAYSNGEFCHHKHNFRSMLSQWIRQHLNGKVSVKPQDIKFFNMPDCVTSKPPSEDHINHLPEDLENSEHETDDKLNLLGDDKNTNVYFYVTSSGKIDPDLTEQFPLFPMDLEISEDLTYLKNKVSQLELVRADGSTNSDPLLEEEAAVGTSIIVIIVICSIAGVTIIVALLFFMVVKRRGATNNYYGRRCTPVSMDAYSMDSVSVYHSFRRKSKRRASGRSVKSYLNQAFDDPNGPTRPLNFAKLTHFISDIDGVYEEFGTIPVNMPKYDELPSGVEDKNRYANVIPVPETRVLLKLLKDSRNSEYINANYVRGARNESKYYIATQAPLDDTVADFWRMIWEQETKVVVMLTDFVEKGIDKCADYLPPSETLDCHRLYGDFQVTLKSRDMREKYVVSNVQLKNLENNLVREVAHMWFTGWPASGVPNEETAFISYILDVRRTRKKLRAKGPIVVHCSPGTGRTGTLLACDIVMRQFEDQRSVDVPRTVYSIRRDRAGAVQTKEQYAFIYRVINLYASKLTSGNLDSL